MARERLVEQAIIPSKYTKSLPLTESNKKFLIEGIEYNTLEAYEFPVWKLDQENKNSRKYPQDLGEKVVKANIWSYGLMNHPTEEGDVEKIWAVENNPHIKNVDGINILFADVYLVGSHGKGLVKDILSVPGAGIGLSSSGFGEVNRDGTVDTKSYDLERYFDFVLNPSYDVWGYQENIKESENRVIQEKTVLDNTIIDKYKDLLKTMAKDKAIDKVADELVIDKEEVESVVKDIKEGSMNKKFSVEEKTFKLSVRNLMKEAEENKDPQDKKDAYEDIKEWFEDVDYAPDMKKEVEEKIDSLDKEIKELAKKGIKTDSLIESEKSLKEKLDKATSDFKLICEKYDVATDILDNLKVYSNKMKELYTNQKAKSNGMIEAKIYKEALDFIEASKTSLKEKDSTITLLSTENKTLKESLELTQKQLNEKSNFESIRRTQLEVTAQFANDKKVTEETKLNEAKKVQEGKDAIALKEASIDVANLDEVAAYYNELEESNSNYSAIKSEILRCKTLYEAQMTVIKLKDLVESNFTRVNTKKIEEKAEEGVYKVQKAERPAVTSVRTAKREGWI